mmetsp:Transcript_19800/g.74855  ORF Transcript_19800/g.74855 Transcript_19800/m.74855 type:complete len:504 (-) Transcript_19800:46-1557(-)
MGNSDSRAATPREKRGPFDDEERRILEKIWEELCTHDSDLETAFKVYFWEFWPDADAFAAFGEAMFTVVSAGQELSLPAFAQGVAQLSRGSSREMLKGVFQVGLALQEPEEGLTKEGLTEEGLTEEGLAKALWVCYHLSAHESGASWPVLGEPSALRSAAESAWKHARKPPSSPLDLQDFTLWCNEECPFLPWALATGVQNLLFGKVGLTVPPGFKKFLLPVFEEEMRVAEVTPAVAGGLFWLACTERDVMGALMKRLYASYADGKSFPRLMSQIEGWGGPSLFLILETETTRELTAEEVFEGKSERSSDEKLASCFGAYTGTPWKERNTFYGDSKAFLFQLAPECRVMRPKSTRGREPFTTQYLNTKGHALPHGLGLGGRVDPSDGKAHFHLFIPDTLDGCTGAASSRFFASGALSVRSTFSIDLMEVWGVAKDERARAAALEAQNEARAERTRTIEKARKVDKAAFMGTEFDRSAFLGKTFNNGARGTEQQREELLDRFKR